MKLEKQKAARAASDQFYGDLIKLKFSNKWFFAYLELI